MAITAGDQQTAAGGAAVNIPPAVVVRDAQSRAMAGVAVQFSVTEGGGSVEGSNPVTDASGVARVTRWTLGTSGAQRLTAQVGALPPAVFQASLAPGTESIEVGLPAGGGSHEITTANHPYRGLKLTVPAGALTGGASWRFRVVTPITPPTLPAGYQVSGPVLEVATEQARATGLMTLDIPISTPAGRSVLIAFRDPARGVTEIMPTVARSATSIRVVTTHLRGDLLPGPTPATSRANSASSRLVPVGEIFPISFLLPAPDVPPLLDPAIDRWPVLENGSAAFPDGHGLAIPALEALSQLFVGPPLASFVKGLDQVGFYAEPAVLGALLVAHRRLNATLPGVLGSLNALLRALPKAERDELVSQSLNANMAVSGVTPVAFTTATGESAAFATAFGSSGTTLSVLSSALPGVLSVGRDPAAGFAGLTVKRTLDALGIPTDGVTPLPSTILPYEELGDLLGDLRSLPGLSPTARAALNKTLAERAGLPEILLEIRALASGPWAPVEADRMVLRSPNALLRILGVDASMMVNFQAGAEVARSSTTTLAIAEVPAISALPRLVLAQMVLSPFVSVSGSLKQVTARLFDLVRAPFAITPDDVTLDDDNDVALEADVPLAPGSGFRIRWQWGDGETTENLGLTTGTHRYDAPGDYPVVATLLSHPDGVVLAADTILARNPQEPFWRITSFEDLDGFLEEETPHAALGSIYDAAFRLLAAPGAGLIAIQETGPGTTSLRLRVLPTSLWDETSCCPPPESALPGEFLQLLGTQPSITHPVGPFFAGFGVTQWSQSTGDLGAGTLTAQVVVGTEPRVIKDLGTQTAPKDLLRTSATRSGTLMTGTITAYAWFQGDDGIDPDDPPATYRLRFTAVRLK
ncbi:MAG: hypothetical protein AB7S39_22230 [Gemmatimonadales bacterium]